jgi:hypothetical protein
MLMRGLTKPEIFTIQSFAEKKIADPPNIAKNLLWQMEEKGLKSLNSSGNSSSLPVPFLSILSGPPAPAPH